MLRASFFLDRQRFCTLTVGDIRVDAFSGNGTHRNNPDSVAVRSEGPLPLGIYYIVDRKSGGFFGKVKSWYLGRDEWFALYRDDGQIDDETFVRSVNRGLFRLHPLGPSGRSEGCVTVQRQEDFDNIRRALLNHGKQEVGNTGLDAYGTLAVGRVLDAVHPDPSGAAVA